MATPLWAQAHMRTYMENTLCDRISIGCFSFIGVTILFVIVLSSELLRSPLKGAHVGSGALQAPIIATVLDRILNINPYKVFFTGAFSSLLLCLAFCFARRSRCFCLLSGFVLDVLIQAGPFKIYSLKIPCHVFVASPLAIVYLIIVTNMQ